MTFKKICEGYGLQRVPRQWANEMACSCCAGNFPTVVLYTTEPITYDGTRQGLTKMLNRMRGNCYCRTHAETMFAPGEEV